ASCCRTRRQNPCTQIRGAACRSPSSILSPWPAGPEFQHCSIFLRAWRHPPDRATRGRQHYAAQAARQQPRRILRAFFFRDLASSLNARGNCFIVGDSFAAKMRNVRRCLGGREAADAQPENGERREKENS